MESGKWFYQKYKIKMREDKGCMLSVNKNKSAGKLI